MSGAALPWTRLGTNQCEICPLDEATTEHCPVAVNIQGLVEAFRESLSHESVEVAVTTAERTFSKATTLQEGISGLLGLIMATSGCPIMERLKPMARFHLPFASLEETTYRMLSMYLVSQLFVKRSGGTPDWDLDGLGQVYADVSAVNRDFAQRVQAAAKKDANVNALVNLDCFGTLVPMTVDSVLGQTRDYFAAYLR